jgi:hypothetical protein
LGALLDKLPILPLSEIKVSLSAHLPERHKKLLKSNMDAIDQGAAFSRGELTLERTTTSTQEPVETIAPTSI